jgi:hypothetical protein
MAVPAPFAPRKPKFLFIDLKGNVVNSGKAAKFLAEVSYFYDSFSISEEGSFVRYYLVFLIVHVVGLYPARF